ncbi:MAG: hypothetical protein Q9205_001960 [Flavoplaca limonia]
MSVEGMSQRQEELSRVSNEWRWDLEAQRLLTDKNRCKEKLRAQRSDERQSSEPPCHASCGYETQLRYLIETAPTAKVKDPEMVGEGVRGSSEVEESKCREEIRISDKAIHAAAGMLITSQRLRDRHPKTQFKFPRGETCNVNFPASVGDQTFSYSYTQDGIPPHTRYEDPLRLQSPRPWSQRRSE